ncbi:hypothetical protein [Bacillus toyonensis]|uniref:hypothetical protein n=1 Tax=Bacillus toyonensis TaxID=155322 RepID=UPI001EE04E08|nr:hypothetical protein [Bacillus toyonensis]UKS61505.1 hypothetical protein K6T24_06285 [Bacillus toyonensis]
MFISDDQRAILVEARRLIQLVYKNTNYEFKEYPSLTTVIDSLDTAINKKKVYLDK